MGILNARKNADPLLIILFQIKLRTLQVLGFLLLMGNMAWAQSKATVAGQLLDENNKGIELVNVAAIGYPGGTSTDESGNYSFEVPADTKIKISFSHVQFESQTFEVKLAPGEIKILNRILKLNDNLMTEAVVNDDANRTTTMTRVDPKIAIEIPTVSGGIEAVLKTFPGVSSNNELSSQYNVRGGNYNENLVYVNDVLIYRPFLVRSGQQEGLSFVNPDLVGSLSFSAGGFEAKYGDKMSSVLDVKYKRPRKFAGSVTGSLLGGAAHVEGSSKDYRFSYLAGVRYRTNQYVLGSLDTKGQYRPRFIDVQGLLNFDINDKWSVSLLANYAQNRYQFVPQDRVTAFGTISDALQLTVYFDGQEISSFETILGALTTEFRPNPKLKLKLIASAFRSTENQTFDVQGEYFLGQLDNNFGSDNLGEVAFNRGIGTFLNHGRDYLTATVVSARNVGKWFDGHRIMDWGSTYQHEIIVDKLSEWNMIDSAGYSIPLNANELQVQEVLKTRIDLQSNRISGFIQNTWMFSDTSKHQLTAGARYHYWDVNKQFIVTPRVNYAFDPQWINTDMIFRASGGMYYQPPFYRELRDLNGTLNKNVRAQQSYHAVIGMDYNFKAWNRPFKLVAEVYYKYLNDLVPYEIDNVRIRYYAQNNARGYATGIDLKLNGEFVQGIESWASMSVMTVQEDIIDDYYYDYYNSDGQKIGYGIENSIPTDSVRVEPGYIPRPTDQRVNFSLYFQDYVPKLPSLKMHLNLVFGSGMPFGPPDYTRYKDTLRIPPYRRVDIGFSYMLLGEKKKFVGPKNPLKHFKSIWISLEVFNLLGTNNTLSYLWISDITNRQYAVPNYLTTRRVNAKIVMKF
ncbi:MAG: TonB-dependent receptor [Flavobacteriales bacterium]|nr:TonB-dependent receptor [Flavobacteriales bacterium]